MAFLLVRLAFLLLMAGFLVIIGYGALVLYEKFRNVKKEATGPTVTLPPNVDTVHIYGTGGGGAGGIEQKVTIKTEVKNENDIKTGPDYTNR